MLGSFTLKALACPLQVSLVLRTQLIRECSMKALLHCAYRRFEKSSLVEVRNDLRQLKMHNSEP